MRKGWLFVAVGVLGISSVSGQNFEWNNNPYFQFTNPGSVPTFPAGPVSENVVSNVWFIDFDSDGDLDIIGADDERTTQGPLTSLRNDGSGNYVDASAEVFPSGAPSFFRILDAAVADFTGDGLHDIYLGHWGARTTDSRSLGGEDVLLVQQADGTLVSEADRIPSVLGLTQSVSHGDIDGDGDIDIYLGN